MEENKNYSIMNTETSPNIEVQPVFFKQTEILKNISGLEICQAVSEVVGDSNLVEGAQLRRYPKGGGLWRIYMTSMEARTTLLATGLSVGDVSVELYSQNPFATGGHDPDKQSIKITVKDIPISVAPESVKEMFVSHGVTITSQVLYGYYRDKAGKLTNLKNGDRVAYASEEELKKSPLPRKSQCGFFTCRVFHEGQPEAEKKCFKCNQVGHYGYQCEKPDVCSACKEADHKAGEPVCKLYASEQDVVVFGGPKDILSNFFPCSVTYKGQTMKSSEHLYQAQKASMCSRPDIAKEIEEAPNAFKAKQIAKKIGCDSQ